jgi:hypothetical protein
MFWRQPDDRYATLLAYLWFKRNKYSDELNRMADYYRSLILRN